MISKTHLAATLALQRPEPARRKICPRRGGELTCHRFAVDGFWVETSHCRCTTRGNEKRP